MGAGLLPEGGLLPSSGTISGPFFFAGAAVFPSLTGFSTIRGRVLGLVIGPSTITFVLGALGTASVPGVDDEAVFALEVTGRFDPVASLAPGLP